MVADLNHLPLTLSHSSKCHSLIADCNHYEIACKEWKCSQSSRLRRERCSSTYNDLQFSEKETIYSNFPSEDEFESSSAGSSYRSRMSSEDLLDIHD
ncbi:hypothetical protein CRYUN_Cryun01aG0152200 [Craigia yunnanensis]